MKLEKIQFSVLRAATAALVLTLAACGGGGSGLAPASTTPVTTFTGKFVDATVVGASYKCGTSTTVSGTTTATGEFTCPTGQAVAFFVGDVSIGSVAVPGAVVTPLDFVGTGASPTNATVANIVRFLMSISKTDPATGTITIDPVVITAATGKTIDFATSAGAAIDALISAVKPGATIYTNAQATTHLSGSVKGLFAGNYSGTFTGTAAGTWSIVIGANGVLSSGSYTNTGGAGSGVVAGSMGTTLSTGSTYVFSGNADGVPWTGTLNVSTRKFSGTWGSGADKGTFTN